MKTKSIIQLSSSCLTRRSSGVIFKNNKELESTGFRIKSGMTRLAQSGSIMLEVVAVLALMGVMGAMLFRQIYQRNQELHNIQMASEIRTVKEAFSAYIQANRSSILANNCTVIPRDDKVEQCTGGNFDDIYDGVAYYLPDGWFNADDLEGAYTLSLWNYLIENDSEKRIVYGIVVPTTDTLPTTGWNFKRAARVALLIGADGGAYDPSITHGEIAGALGAWQIESTGIVDADTYPDGTYVATTGIDVFAPEYEMPEGDMKLPNDWSLALKGLHAYNHFSVGNSGSGNCYSIQHNRYASSTTGDNVEGKVENDTVPNGLSGDCKPLFWVGGQNGGVDSSNGNVYVATDLKIGDIETIDGAQKHNEALTLTKEGVIKQKDGITIDGAGRIISRDTVFGNNSTGNIGDLVEGEHYVLDPGRVSTMMDIRLASRGGVRLSDILPNYILKNVYYGECEIKKGSDNDTYLQNDAGTKRTTWCDLKFTEMKANGVNYNFRGDLSGNNQLPNDQCPSGYKNAVIVIPTRSGYLPSKVLKESHKHYIDLTTSEVGGHDHTVRGNTKQMWVDRNNNGSIDDGEPMTLVSDVPNCQLFFTISKTSNPLKTYNVDKGGWYHDDSGSSIHITMGYHNMGTLKSGAGAYKNCPIPDTVSDGVIERVQAVVQTYCVWTPSLYDGDQPKCKAAGYVYDGGKCTTTHFVDPNWDTNANGEVKAACEAYGFTWYDPDGSDSTTSGTERCQFKYVSPSDINNTTKVNRNFQIAGANGYTEESDAQKLARVAAVCKAAGYKWNGTDCSCPDGTSWDNTEKKCK